MLAGRRHSGEADSTSPLVCERRAMALSMKSVSLAPQRTSVRSAAARPQQRARVVRLCPPSVRIRLSPTSLN
jgi:hypothetical protein